MKKIILTIIAVVGIVSLIGLPVLAAAYTYQMTMVETSGNTYSSFPFISAVANNSLVSNGYMSSSGLDAQVVDGSSLPAMLTNTQTLFVDNLNPNQNKTFQYTTGNTPATSMPIIVGNGGYLSTSESAALEPGSNFSLISSGLVDTSILVATGNTLTNGTGTATGSPITLANGLNTITVTGLGNFTIALSNGVSASVASGSTAVTGSPVQIGQGTNTITTTGSTGNFTVTLIESKNIVSKANALQVNVDPSTPGTIDDTTYNALTSPSLAPNGAGNSTAIASVTGAATHWQAELTSDGNTSYVSTTVTNPTWQVDEYATSDLPTTNCVITSVVVHIVAERPGGSNGGYGRTELYTHSTLYDGASNTLSVGSYTDYSTTYTTNPFTGVTWTAADVNAMQIGVGLSGSVTNDEVRCTQVYAIVSYYPGFTVSVTGVSSGVHTIQTKLNSGVFEEDVDNPTLASNGSFETATNVSNLLTNGTMEAGSYSALGTNMSFETGTETNVLSNSSFETGNPPTGYTVGGTGATFAQSTTQVKFGTYSAALTRSGNDCYFYQSYTGYATYKGAVMTLGCWVYDTTANTVYLQLDDGVTTTNSATNSGITGWQWLAVSKTLSPSATHLYASFHVQNSNITAYFDGAELLYNSAPTGWTETNCLLSQSQYNVETGSYSAAFVGTYSPNEYAYESLSTTVGYGVTFGCWVQCATANGAELILLGGSNPTTYSIACPADGQWHWLSVSTRVVSSPITVAIAGMTQGTVAYFDGAELIANGIPTGWTQGAGADVSMTAVNPYDGTYSMELAAVAAGNAYASETTSSSSYDGDMVTLSVWAKALPGTQGIINIQDGTNNYSSGYVPNDGAWHLMTVSGIIAANATQFTTYLASYNQGDIIYFDDATLTGVTPPLGWNVINGTIAQSNSYAKYGSYSIAVSNFSSNTATGYQPIAMAYDGQTVTLGCWVLSTTSNEARIGIYDGAVSDWYSSYCPGDGTWHWLTVTATLVSGQPYIKLWEGSGGASYTAYFDGASLVVGSTIIPTASNSISSVACPGSIASNSNAWIFDQNDVMPYITYCKLMVGGTEVLKYQPITIISGSTLPDLDTGDGVQNGTISFGNNPTGISITLGSFGATTPSQAAAGTNYANQSPGTIISDSITAPPQLYTELDTSKIPFGTAVDAILNAGGIPRALWWFPFIYFGICIVGMMIYEATSPQGVPQMGSLLAMCVAIEVLLVIFGVMGTVGVSGMIPLWSALMFIFPAGALILSRKHVGWG